jgi:predicted amino acid racemase
LEVRLDRIADNARVLVERLGARGIEVCGVTKATRGSPEVAAALLAAGVGSIGESRLENVEGLRRGGVTAGVTLVRAPMLSQIDRVVAGVDLSLNSELAVIEALSSAAAAQGRTHGVVVMVELGDLREGVMPADLDSFVERVLALSGVVLRGVGTNLACQSGVVPDAANMAELTELVVGVEDRFGVVLDIVSGGNSANVRWALDEASDVGRINHLRLGESILLGCDPLDRTPIEGLHLDAFRLIGEVIESKRKPRRSRGALAQTAFGAPSPPDTTPDGLSDSMMRRVIVALGRQDTEPGGLELPPGYAVLGASSDHLVLNGGDETTMVGAELGFGVDYAALLRASTSSSVTSFFLPGPPPAVEPVTAELR